jgi:hypothetical protein
MMMMISKGLKYESKGHGARSCQVLDSSSFDDQSLLGTRAKAGVACVEAAERGLELRSSLQKSRISCRAPWAQKLSLLA